MTRPFILIIEDQASLAVLYEDAMRLSGFDVRVIKDGLEALNYIETAPEPKPLFIVLDMNLPRVAGRDILKHIRKRHIYDTVPVIVATANSVMANIIQPELSDQDYVMMKPISMADLQAKAKLFKQKALEAEQARTAEEQEEESVEPVSAAADAEGAEDVENTHVETDTATSTRSEDNAETDKAPEDKPSEDNEVIEDEATEDEATEGEVIVIEDEAIDDHKRETRESVVISDAELDKNTHDSAETAKPDTTHDDNVDDDDITHPTKPSPADDPSDEDITPQQGGW